MTEPAKPCFTERLICHMNGGSKFSSLTHEVLRDGEPTGITHFRRTNGSPRYLITEDAFVKDDEFFDRMASRDGLRDWLERHSQTEPAQ